MTAVPVPPLTDVTDAELAEVVIRSGKALVAAQASDVLFVAEVREFFYEDFPRLVKAFHAAQAELARLDPAKVAAWIAERDDLAGQVATVEQENDRLRAALARTEETAAEARQLLRDVELYANPPRSIRNRIAEALAADAPAASDEDEDDPLSATEIAARVEAWHACDGDGMELHEYLGMTWDEYKAWAGPKTDEPDGIPEPCQPIGCDNGYHLPGCYYATVDGGGTDTADAPAASEPACGSCGGDYWVDDENWQPERWELQRGRIPGSGRIPCGICNHGGWDVPDGKAPSPSGAVGGHDGAGQEER